ncbi:MAG: hypothetical protein ACYDBB_07825 [Armatimonadota bacterium]
MARAGKEVAPPAALPVGFVLAWWDESQTPHQARLAVLSNSGKLGKAHIAVVGRDYLWPLAVAATPTSVSLAWYDRTTFPFRVITKEIALADLR